MLKCSCKLLLLCNPCVGGFTGHSSHSPLIFSLLIKRHVTFMSSVKLCVLKLLAILLWLGESYIDSEQIILQKGSEEIKNCGIRRQKFLIWWNTQFYAINFNTRPNKCLSLIGVTIWEVFLGKMFCLPPKILLW